MRSQNISRKLLRNIDIFETLNITKHSKHLPNINNPILDTHGKLLSVKNPKALQLLTLKPVHLARTTIPHSKAFKYFVLPTHPLNCTLAQLMSQGLKILL
jgi:hypothetical protein